MKRLNGNALTEKGMIKTAARKTLMECIDTDRNMFAEATRNANGTYSIAIEDASGNTIYINFEISISAKNAADRAARKTTRKAKEAESFELAD